VMMMMMMMMIVIFKNMGLAVARAIMNDCERLCHASGVVVKMSSDETLFGCRFCSHPRPHMRRSNRHRGDRGLCLAVAAASRSKSSLELRGRGHKGTKRCCFRRSTFAVDIYKIIIRCLCNSNQACPFFTIDKFTPTRIRGKRCRTSQLRCGYIGTYKPAQHLDLQWYVCCMIGT
jgi:hypothetical protein